LVVIQVLDDDSGEPLPGVKVQLTLSRVGFEASQTTDADGMVTFAGVTPSTSPYVLTVTAAGFYKGVEELTVGRGETALTVNLTPGVFATVEDETATLRSGPGAAYDILGDATTGDVLVIIGQDDAGEWLAAEMDDGHTCWVEVVLVNVEGDLDRTPVIASPPTPTPVPTTAPAPTTAPPPPQPPSFDGVALRDSVVHLRWVLDQLGGLLDRLYSGQAESCGEFMNYYLQTFGITRFEAVPGDWQGVYNEYVWAAEHTRATNESVFALCLSGGGVLNDFNYSVARAGVYDSVARLIPAIDTANALLGQ